MLLIREKEAKEISKKKQKEISKKQKQDAKVKRDLGPTEEFEDKSFGQKQSEKTKESAPAKERKEVEESSSAPKVRGMILGRAKKIPGDKAGKGFGFSDNKNNFFDSKEEAKDSETKNE